MIRKIGTKIYYCLLTGNVIKIIGDTQGYVRETSFDEDIEIYTELKERDKNSIGLLNFEYGEYLKLSKNSTGVMVNLETKELIFTYEELPSEPVEPTEIDKLKEEQEQQNEEILVNMMANSKGVNPMGEVYATLIIKGVKTVDDVPVVLREQVIERLKQLEVTVK